jgi:flagellum-specific ATP synthase
MFEAEMSVIASATGPELRGTLEEVRGATWRVRGLPVAVGSTVRVHRRGQGGALMGEVVGIEAGSALVLPLGGAEGVARGDWVSALHAVSNVRVGNGLLGRVLNGLGEPIDGKGPVHQAVSRPLHGRPIDPLCRPRIKQPLGVGVRAIDGLHPLGRGQRIGIFAPPGVGKSTLLATCARRTSADVSVIGLIGERGREVRDFIDGTLGEAGMDRSVVVVATADEPALVRLRAARVATAIAEYFRDEGNDVLLVLDSVTRFCQAQRQVGLAAGEPPATRGYPPSVFSTLPELFERAGNTDKGSITALYAVLVEGGDMDEPIADACKGVLDGHIQLDRKLAERGHYPAIDVLTSISRVSDEVTDEDHRAARRRVLALMSAYREIEDLLNLGAYAAGSNADADLAIAVRPAIDQLLREARSTSATDEKADFLRTKAQLLALIKRVQDAEKELSARRRPMNGPRG